MRRASSARVAGSAPEVSLRKIGASPKGFTTGKTAPTIRRTARDSKLSSGGIAGRLSTADRRTSNTCYLPSRMIREAFKDLARLRQISVIVSRHGFGELIARSRLRERIGG